MAMHIGKPVVTPLITVGQTLVINTQEMQDGGVQVMDMNRILDSSPTLTD